jgi:hypothetical protein
MDMLQHFRYSSFKVSTDVHIENKEGQSLVLDLVIRFGKEEVPLYEIQKMLLAGQRAILLKDGSLGILGEEWLQQYSTIIKHGKVNGKKITISRWMALNEKDGEEEQVLKKVFKKRLVG